MDLIAALVAIVIRAYHYYVRVRARELHGYAQRRGISRAENIFTTIRVLADFMRHLSRY